MSSGPVVVFELQAENAIQRWKDMAGPVHPDEARKVAPSSLRARFGTGKSLLAHFRSALLRVVVAIDVETFFFHFLLTARFDVFKVFAPTFLLKNVRKWHIIKQRIKMAFSFVIQ